MFNSEILRRLGYMISLCYEINSEKTLCEETGDLPTVFLNFSGHVCDVDLQIHENGWENESYPEYQRNCYLTDENAVIELDEMIAELTRTHDNKKHREEHNANVRNVQAQPVPPEMS